MKDVGRRGRIWRTRSTNHGEKREAGGAGTKKRMIVSSRLNTRNASHGCGGVGRHADIIRRASLEISTEICLTSRPMVCPLNFHPRFTPELFPSCTEPSAVYRPRRAQDHTGGWNRYMLRPPSSSFQWSLEHRVPILLCLQCGGKIGKILGPC